MKTFSSRPASSSGASFGAPGELDTPKTQSIFLKKGAKNEKALRITSSITGGVRSYNRQGLGAGFICGWGIEAGNAYDG
jgi:hypothetical protein